MESFTVNKRGNGKNLLASLSYNFGKKKNTFLYKTKGNMERIWSLPLSLRLGKN